MANFHTNNLTIAASATDMVKVLLHFASILALSAKKYDFTAPILPEDVSLNEAFRLVSPVIDDYYFCAFSAEPESRGLSDSASVVLDKVGKYQVLHICYSTAWGSNLDDISEFVSTLPAGEYAIGLLDADEYDWYDEIGYDFWLASGGEENTCPADENDCGCTDVHSLYQQKQSEEKNKPQTMMEVMKKYAVANWSDYYVLEDEEDFEN